MDGWFVRNRKYYISLDNLYFLKTCACGTEMIKDLLSEKYGDYCPNENCLFKNYL